MSPQDFDRFDWIIAMDRENLSNLRALQRKGTRARLHLLRDFDPEPGDGDVPDPYYGGPDGFESVYALVERSSQALLDHIEGEKRRGADDVSDQG